MDQLSLGVLGAELRDDCRVLAEAARSADQFFHRSTPGFLEATAYHLNRAYNAIEQICLRIAKAFENQIEDDSGWHAELLRRLTIELPGVRPALFERVLLPDLQDLKGFRHLVRNAYDLTLRQERIAPLVAAATQLAAQMPRLCEQFIQTVAREQGWSLS